MSAFDYSKWDKIELSDDEDDVHPNIDKDSLFRLKHRTRVEREEDDAKARQDLERKLGKLKDELKTYVGATQEHLKAQKLRKEIEKVEGELEVMEKKKTWNADNMCKTKESRSIVSETTKPTPAPEPRLSGESVAEGYCEFVEEHEDLLEEYIALGAEEDLEVVAAFLRQHGGTLLEGEHAESYLLLDCLEKEMNGEHEAMVRSARQNQLLTQVREFSRASSRPARDCVNPIFQRLVEHEPTRESFDDTVQRFVFRLERRAVEKKREMDAQAAEERRRLNPPGPGGLDPLEVLETLPLEMRRAFETTDPARLQAAVEALSDEEARYHLRRCEDSGLWVPHAEASPCAATAAGSAAMPASGRSGGGMEVGECLGTVGGPPKGVEAGDDVDRERAITLLSLVEDFCSGPEFLNGLQDLIFDFAGRFDDREDDHPHEWYDCFRRYAAKVESLLESFLQEHGLSREELSRLCEWARQEAPDALFSVDYLQASIEYDAFVTLMLDWKQLQDYEVPCGSAVAADDGASGGESPS